MYGDQSAELVPLILGAERVKQGQGLKALGGAHPYPNFP